MAKNEFGVESSDSGGFGAGVGNDFDFMFEEANNRSVVDDEVSEARPVRERVAEPSFSFDTETEAPVVVEAPATTFMDDDEDEPSFAAPSGFDETGESFNETTSGFDAPSSFGETGNLDEMFSEAESASVVDDEIREPVAEPSSSFESFDDSFENFGAEPQQEEQQSFETSFESSSEVQDNWIDPAIAFDEPEVAVAPQPIREPVAPTPTPEPVYYAPAVEEPRPSFVPESVETVAPARPSTPNPTGTEADVDYIERVILTSDAIRELPEGDAKAVNMFITAGQPVESHQELVLTALLADRQILKTSEAILEAKAKESVDRAFHILGLDDTTFVDFGKILSHDLETTETVIFEGDRLRYARKLVDVVEALPAVSIKRFEAVQSVLGAGELNS